MDLTTLSQDEPWMTPEERDLNRDFIQSTTVLLAARGVPETPLIMLRVNDVIATWLLARRLESALAPEPGEPAPCPSPALAGAIGKCRDRLRRAMKDLEACCARDAVHAGQGLGLIEKMGEVLILPLTRRRASSCTPARTRPIGWTLRSIAVQEFSGLPLWTSAFRSGTSAV